MTSIAKLSNGALLKVGDAASPEVFTTVPEVTKLSGPSVNFDLLDVSSHDTSGFFREFIPGFADGESIKASVNWRPSNTVHKNLRIDGYARTLRNMKIVFPDSTDNTVTMATYLKNFPPNADVGVQMTAQLEAKITGAPVWS